jgi:DNA-binding winged helix-turn-helix (wHTH) protein/tetratricopeptide (TPR) repeat protein
LAAGAVILAGGWRQINCSRAVSQAIKVQEIFRPDGSVMQAAQDISFGRFRLDLANECLWQGTRAISLRPKAFAVLKLLVERPGLLVTKQQVLDAVWPDTFVGDAVLKDNIRQLREALNDNAESPTYIETAHRRGYRFIGKIPGAVVSETRSSLSKTTRAQPPSKTPAITSSPLTSGILGRETELANLGAWLDGARAGQRHIVFVTGEAGIGKTTVLQAFLEQASQISGIRIARGQCLEHYGAGEAYLPVLDGFSRLCRSPGGAQVLDSLRRVAPAWLAQMPSAVPPSERERLQSETAGATRERMLREMAEAIEVLTSESPLLLVLEDLHWSDYSTLDLVSYLARRHDPARLMVIGTYRPVDLILSEHPLKGVKRELQAHGLCHELPLEYLSKGAVKDYLEARFPGNDFPLQLRRIIYQRTEGNPLFMVNLVDYLARQKIVAEDQGVWRLRVDLSNVEQEVPTNLRQLIETQIERLSPDERTVLEGASVAGLECSCAAIAAGLDRPVEWVEKISEELARRHQFLTPALLLELPDGTVTPQHRFIHILYREVAYRLVPPMRRAQIHHRIAECEVAIYGERQAEIAAELAMHFEQSRDWPRALQYLVQAAENAMRKSAHHEAAGLARRGLEALKAVPVSSESLPQEIALRMILIVSLMATKGFTSPELAQLYAEEKDLFGLKAQSPQLFNMLYLLGFSYIMGGKLKAAQEIAERLVELSAEINDPTLIMEANRAMGATLIELGRCTEALEHLDRASQLYSANRYRSYTLLNIGHDCKVLSECFAGRALWTLGFADEGLERIEAGLAFAREISHPQSSVGAAHFASQFHQLRGEPLLARAHAIEVLKLAEEYGLEYWVALGKIDLGWADAEMGQEHGIALMRQGLAGYEARGGRLWSTHFLGLIAGQLLKAGELEEGLSTILKAITQSEQSGERYALAELYRIKGELIIKSGDRALARSCFEQSLTIAKQQQTKAWELKAQASMDRFAGAIA